jgi:DNA-binding CsgD family transcriptional regulator
MPTGTIGRGSAGVRQTPGLFDERQWAVAVSRLRLSPRESTIVGLCFDSWTITKIAAKLDLSPHTVRAYLRRVYLKNGVTTRFDLLLLAVQAVFTKPARLMVLKRAFNH